MTKLTSEVARESATIIKDPNGVERNLIAGPQVRKAGCW